MGSSLKCHTKVHNLVKQYQCMLYNDIMWCILGINHIFVVSVINILLWLINWGNTWQYIVVRYHISVSIVMIHSIDEMIWKIKWWDTLGRNHIYAGSSHCDKSLAFGSSLKLHMKVHTVVKPYQCSQCDKMLTSNCHLKTYMTVHSGEKPYSCSHCDKSFTMGSSLKCYTKVHMYWNNINACFKMI